MEFTFGNEQKLVVAQQALDLLISEKALEKAAFVKSLVAKGWEEFVIENESIEIYESYKVIVHPSVAGSKWLNPFFYPEKEGIDSSLYCELS